MSEGKYKEAIKNFQEALSHGPKRVTPAEVNITYYLASCYYLENRFDEAIDACDNLIAYDEKNADALYLRGSIYLQTDKQKKALEDYETAAKIASKDYELAIAIYDNLHSKGLDTEAMSFINHASEIGGDDADSLFYRGRIYEILGQEKVARTTFKRALDEGNDEAALYLTQGYLRNGKKKKAVKEAMSFAKRLKEDDSDEKKKLSSSDFKRRALAGELLLSVGKYKKALEIYESALSAEKEAELISTSHKDLLRGQICSLEYTGDFSQALSLAKEYLQNYPSDRAMVREISFLETR